MTDSIDLSVGQRLAIGFGAVLLVVLVALALVLQWHRESARAEADYSERIAPVVERANDLERRIYRVAVDMRAYELNPGAEALEVFRASVGAAHSSLDALAAEADEPDAEALFESVSQATQRYVARAEATVEGTGEFTAADEDALRQLRESVLATTGDFIDMQGERASAALAEIAALRGRTSESLVAMAVIATGILLIVALLTTRAVSFPARALLGVARSLAAGDWHPALALAYRPTGGIGRPVRNELGQLANAFGSAAVAIERREARLRADGRVAKAVGSTLDRVQLCNDALSHIVEHVGAEVGVLYSVRDGRFQPIANHALAGLPPVEIGHGILGRAVRERRIVIVGNIPADTDFAVRVGYDRASPRSIAAVPVLFQSQVLGVVVVASLRDFAEESSLFLEASAAQLGIGLHNVAAHEETQRLLGEVRESNERIQAQNEELQVQNEEIQAQNEEIQAQSEELQVQQEEIQAQNEELMQQGEELRRHVARLADADANKNRFLGVLAHELRNPIAPITNSIHILKRSVPGSDNAQRAQVVIERQVTHLVRLIDDLLDVTRISEGKISVKREPLDLVETIRSSIEDHSPDFEQRAIRVEIDVPDESVFVNGDPTRMAQVVGNLLNNTIKFAEGGRVQVSLRVDHGNGDAVLRVVDDGVGMERDLLPHLFQPFSQGVSGLARVPGGLGLGLALVKALVTLHDGRVAAHSDGPGRGAEFTIRLPLAAVQGTQRHDDNAPLSAPLDRPTPRRVLVVEDNVDAAESLREALELEGYEVAIAHSGPDGLERAATFTPEVVLCDIGLPGLDGYDVARRLRADPRMRSVVLIALSGYGAQSDKEQARSAGFDLHLAKPLKVPAFEQTIAELVRTRN